MKLILSACNLITHRMQNLYFIVIEQVGVLAIAVTLASCVTSPPIPPEERIIEGVFEVGKTKDELFEASMVWMVKAVENSGAALSTFSWFDSEAAVEYEDKEAGRIMGKIEIKVTYRFFGTCPTRFMLTVEVQDGKVRATAEDAYYVYRKRYQKPYGNEKWWGGRMNSKEDHYRQIDRFIDNEDLMSSYKPEVLKLFEDLKAALIEEEGKWSPILLWTETTGERGFGGTTPGKDLVRLGQRIYTPISTCWELRSRKSPSTK